MKTESIKVQKKPFLKISLEPIYQKNEVFYITKMQAQDFLRVFTVEPAKYDIEKQSTLASQFPDDKAYYMSLIKKDQDRLQDKPFERTESIERINKIRDFLNKEEYAFFPNTIIVTCELINDSPPYSDVTSFNDLSGQDIGFLFDSGLSFLEHNGHHISLYTPDKPNALVIIDGQHRVKGLKEADEKVKTQYELVVAFIIEVNRSIIAKQFYTINYYQKPVNKSLLYHLSGEFSDELTEIVFLHEAVKLLNEIDYSPFFKRIKMLGVIPRDLNRDERMLMTISQAFLIDYLKRTISGSAKETLYPPIFLYYFRRKEFQIELIRFIIKYFTAIRQARSKDWEDPQTSVVCKTIGVGALIRTMHFIYVKAFIKDYRKDPGFIKRIKVADLSRYLMGIETVDFSSEGQFGRTASSGSLNRLKEHIVENIGYLTNKTYVEFIADYKRLYLSEYSEWLKENT